MENNRDVVKGGKKFYRLLPQAFTGIKKIGIIGWNAEAFAQAQNLRDSLADSEIIVKVGLPEGSSFSDKARSIGFTEESGTLGEMWVTVTESDLVLLLVPDLSEAYNKVFSHMKPNTILGLSSGFLLGLLQSQGQVFPPHISVVAVCPMRMGNSLRELYLKDEEVDEAGVASSFSVHQDVDGRAANVALGWSVALGCRLTFATTLEREYRAEMLGERGAVRGFIWSCFKKLGNKKTAEFCGNILEFIISKGMLQLYNSLSSEELILFRRAYCASYLPCLEIMYECYEEVNCNNEIRSVLRAARRFQEKEGLPAFPIVDIENKERRGQVDETVPFHGDMTGIYVAFIMSQIEVLRKKGHCYSEVIGKSLIKAFDYSRPEGVSFTFDNCSTSATLGLRKWAPRFEYVLSNEVYPAIQEDAPFDEELIDKFLKDPVHGALECFIAKLQITTL